MPDDKKTLEYFDLGGQSLFFAILTLSKSVQYFISSRGVKISGKKTSQVRGKKNAMKYWVQGQKNMNSSLQLLQFMTRFRCS